MEERLANSWRLSINEKKFIEAALLSDLRIDGRRPFDYRNLSIKFGRDDGSSEVQLGQTHVMAFVTGQLVQPYRDRPNEGTLSVFTEFSPMADPSFEGGRPGEFAVELGRVIDRGLRESRAVDTESLCVVSGKSVWAIRIDLHILDNGGNLVDASNIAALAALLTFRRPECSLGGDNGQEVIVHPPEVREPLPLIIHHLPIAVTFAFFSNEGSMVVDPTHFEEAVMGGRMTITLNSNEDICAIQKAGGEGVSESDILRCLRIACVKAGDMTTKIKNTVEAYNTERALRKIKRHPSSVPAIGKLDGNLQDNKKQSIDWKGVEESTLNHVNRLNLKSEGSVSSQCESNVVDNLPLKQTNKNDEDTKNFIGGPSSWDPYSECVDPELLKATLASRGIPKPKKEREESRSEKMKISSETNTEDATEVNPPSSDSMVVDTTSPRPEGKNKTLKNAVKLKNRRKKKTTNPSPI